MRCGKYMRVNLMDNLHSLSVSAVENEHEMKEYFGLYKLS